MADPRQDDGREAPGRGYARTSDLHDPLPEDPHGMSAAHLARRLGARKNTLFLMLQHCREMRSVTSEGALVNIGPVLLRRSCASRTALRSAESHAVVQAQATAGRDAISSGYGLSEAKT